MLKKQGFTLIEVLLIIIVIVIIAILAAGIIIALNRGRQFAETRNTQRVTHLNEILRLIVQNMIDNQESFKCAEIPTTSATMSSTGYDIAPCLVPTYTPRLPYDPKGGTECFWNNTTSYNTCYLIYQEEATGRIFLEAPYAELGESIIISE